jgi:transmembrane sensor
MKLNINIPAHSNAIAKYIAGEMNSSEIDEFEKVASSNTDNLLLINEMKNDWKLIGKKEMNRPNVDRAWSSIISKLESDSLIENPTSISMGSKNQWFKWAAAIVIILVTSTLFLTTYTSNVILESTAEGNTLVHTLNDGSTVYLASNTTLKYNKRYGRSNREISLKGEAFFDVSSNPNLPFIVETEDASIQVLGTSFNVKSSSQSNFELVVQTGKVNVTSKLKKTAAIMAEAGDRVTLVNNQLTISPQSDAQPFNMMEQKFQFKDEELSNLLLVLNKTYGANILLDSPVIGDRRITVTFINNSIPSMVEVISATLGLEVKYENNSIILWQP